MEDVRESDRGNVFSWRELLRIRGRRIGQKSGTGNRWLEQSFDGFKWLKSVMYLTARLLRSDTIYESLLLASAIASLLCIVVFKTPSIDVIEPAVESRRRLCLYRSLEPGLWGESICGKGYWDDDDGLVNGNPWISTDCLEFEEDITCERWTAWGLSYESSSPLA